MDGQARWPSSELRVIEGVVGSVCGPALARRARDPSVELATRRAFVQRADRLRTGTLRRSRNTSLNSEFPVICRIRVDLDARRRELDQQEVMPSGVRRVGSVRTST